jgi:hypothetical protein
MRRDIPPFLRACAAALAEARSLFQALGVFLFFQSESEDAKLNGGARNKTTTTRSIVPQKMATLSLALFALALANDAALPRTVARGRVPGHKDVTPEGAPAKGDTVINYLTSEVSALAPHKPII